MQNQHTEQLTLSELKKSDEIINQTNDNLVNVLQDPLSSPTLTEKEKGDFEKLKKMVQAHEDISLFKDTQEMLSTVP
ncbi:MAG: hypothetical protein K6E76_01145 [Patescibacteria group bacterium]|nr:hypothetical protein [Patescibacteria group bacterium]